MLPTGETTTAVPVQNTSSASSNWSTDTSCSATCITPPRFSQCRDATRTREMISPKVDDYHLDNTVDIGKLVITQSKASCKILVYTSVKVACTHRDRAIGYIHWFDIPICLCVIRSYIQPSTTNNNGRPKIFPYQCSRPPSHSKLTTIST